MPRPNLVSVYKGCKIEWDTDECTAALEKPQQHRRENIPPKKKNAPVMNRFQLLDLDGTEDGSQNDDQQETNGITFTAGFPHSTASIAA